jgi:hypothetical protein
MRRRRRITRFAAFAGLGICVGLASVFTYVQLARNGSGVNGRDSSRLALMLTEFTALRAEIVARSTNQHTLLGLYLTAIGAMSGIILTHNGDALLLLIVPPISWAISLVHLDHTRHGNIIGLYFKSLLWPSLVRETGGDVPGWEEFKDGRHRRIDRLVYAGPIAIMYLVPAFGAIALLVLFMVASPSTLDLQPGLGTLSSRLVVTGLVLGTILVLHALLIHLPFHLAPTQFDWITVGRMRHDQGPTGGSTGTR